MSQLFRIDRLGLGLPPRLRYWLVDLFFRYTPVWVLTRLWMEAGGYFKYRRPRRGEVVIDAGAWKGHFTIIAARLVGPRGSVIAIEPQPEMANHIVARLKAMKFHNISVVNAGLFDRAGTIEVSKNPTAAFTAFDQSTAAEKETVNLRTLDDIVGSLGLKQVHFIKMDIEGAELEALAGAPATFGTVRPFVAVASYHIRSGQITSGPVEAILRRYGYTTRTGNPAHLTTWGWPGAAKAAPDV